MSEPAIILGGVCGSGKSLPGPLLARSLPAGIALPTEADALLFILLECPREIIEARIKARTGHFMSPSMIGSQFPTP